MKYKKFLSYLFSVLITLIVIDLHNDIVCQEIHLDKTIHAPEQSNIITIATDNQDFPEGQYWKSETFIAQDLNNSSINPSSVDIGDESYTNITESTQKKDVTPDDESLFPGQYNHPELQKNLYLGSFIDPISEQIVYVYGIKNEELNDSYYNDLEEPSDDDNGDDEE